MTDFQDNYSFTQYEVAPDTDIMEINGEYYLIQGDLDDKITVWRKVSDLFEIERDEIQKMLGL